MAQTIAPEQMAQAIGEILQTFNHSVDTLVDVAAKQTAEAGASVLRSNSPKKSGRYARTWKWKPTKRGTCYIYNDKNYRLTHLLEKGHKTQYKTGKYGKLKMSRPVPHISVVEAQVQKDFEWRITHAIEYQK